ncbi:MULTISPECIES: cytosolic protein [Bacillus]|uniref:cytosolic protein n=1 Tax=Bacillus TaxID=1386 RepID=UPI000BB6FDCE|nr:MULTISPECIES: cytosolic protein [Bacillus]
MALIQNVKTFFSTHAETRENHMDKQLKSRYYKITNKNALKAVKEVVEKTNGYTVKSVSEEHGEIAVSINNGKKAFMIITVISVRAFETAVDFSVSTETSLPFDFGFSKKQIVHMYEKLDKSLTFIGSGLND